VETLAKFISAYSLPRIASLGCFISSDLIECNYHVARTTQNPVCRDERPAAIATFKKLVEALELLAPTIKSAHRDFLINFYNYNNNNYYIKRLIIKREFSLLLILEIFLLYL
jgi:hypothetical protein